MVLLDWCRLKSSVEPEKSGAWSVGEDAREIVAQLAFEVNCLMIRSDKASKAEQRLVRPGVMACRYQRGCGLTDQRLTRQSRHDRSTYLDIE